VSDGRKPGNQDSMSFRVQWSQKSRNLMVNVYTEAEDIDKYTADCERLVRAPVNSRVYELQITLSLFVVTICNCLIQTPSMLTPTCGSIDA
jgi:hypothetical protein